MILPSDDLFVSSYNLTNYSSTNKASYENPGTHFYNTHNEQ